VKDASFRLSRRQVTLLVFAVTICVTPFTYDSVLLLYLGRQAWLGLLPALAVGLVGCGVAGALAARFPGRNVTEYAQEALGPWAGRLFLLLLGLVLLAGAPANLHAFARVIHFAELPRTPPYYITALMTAIVAYACYGGPEVIARASEVLAPLVVAGLAAIYLGPLATVKVARLAPLQPFPWSAFWLPMVLSALGTARGFLCLLIVGGAAREPDRLWGPAMAATAAAWVLLALSVVLPVAVLGADLAQQMRYPLLGVTGTISFRWLPFQRITSLTVLIWQMLMYSVLAFYLWAGVFVLCAACGIRNWRPWLMAGAGLTAYLGGMPLSPPATRWGIDAWNFAVVAAGVVLPAPLLLRRRPASRQGAL
jgi:spore germination protein KB